MRRQCCLSSSTENQLLVIKVIIREEYEAVVVGGGHNGLVAAAYLARYPTSWRSCVDVDVEVDVSVAVDVDVDNVDAGGGDDGNVVRARGQDTDFVLRLGVSTAVFERRHVLGGVFFILMKTWSRFLQLVHKSLELRFCFYRKFVTETHIIHSVPTVDHKRPIFHQNTFYQQIA